MDKYVAAKENLSTIQQQQIREQFNSIVQTLYPDLGSDVFRVFEEPGTLLCPRPTTHIEKGWSAPVNIWSWLPLTIAESINPDLAPEYLVNVALAVEFFVAAFDLLQTIEEKRSTLFLIERGPFLLFNVVTALLALSQQTLLLVTPHVPQAAALLSLLQLIQNGTSAATTYFYQVSNQADPLFDNSIHSSYETFLSLACHIGAISANATSKLCSDFTQLGVLLGTLLTIEEENQQVDHDTRSKIQSLLAEIEEHIAFSPSLRLVLQDILQSQL
ncbi:hypothetical protein [Dictyobacter arantiisoli]|uniref:Uncharacterized protein n=1 Tax=Dictyobacter arantiisoli TaxID=2014874 RepID=A0A5A5TDT8_9CHLR|nr:hypothetical protein [Dictyobacter arantiisoli]GCF09582.1 hypothetical protein KDI_31460 [Dictyobacter arantiisoli]